MGNAFITRMPAGIPGVITRPDQCTIEPGIMDTDTPVTAYGVFVKKVSGKVQPIASGDAATVVKGLLVKPFPTSQYSSSDSLTVSTPDPNMPCDVLKRGYMSVKFGGTTAAADGQVYVRVTASGQLAVGSIEEGADGGKCVAVTGCYFKGAADSNGNVEVEFNL